MSIYWTQHLTIIFDLSQMVNVNLEFGYLDQNAEITKEDEKKRYLTSWYTKMV